MLDLTNPASPKGAWLSQLAKDWGAIEPIAHAILAENYDAPERDARLEVMGAWLRLDPTTVVAAAMSLALGREDDAKEALRASLQTFCQLAPAWAATVRTPTRRQVLNQFAGSGSDLDLKSFIDGLSASDLRAVARDNITKGRPLPPRADGDDGGPCTNPLRVIVTGHREVAGLRIPQATVTRDPAPAATSSSRKVGDAARTSLTSPKIGTPVEPPQEVQE